MPNPTTINEDQPMTTSDTLKALALYRAVAESSRDQWGDDYLWDKWGHGDQMKEAEKLLQPVPAKKTDEELVEMMCEAGRAAYEDALGNGESCYPAYQISMRAALAVVRGNS